jgi:prolyl 4-hydroxylase
MQDSAETFRKQAARAAYGWGRPKSWEDALSLIRHAADAGEPEAEQELALVTQAPLAELLQSPDADLLTDRAQIGACEGFAPPGFAEWLIDRAKDQLVSASMYKAENSEGIRTAQDFAFGPQRRDLVIAIMQERAAHLTRVPVEFHEPPNIISYEPGQEFSTHTDFLDPRAPEYQADLQNNGQRIATVVTYLNEEFEGAETWFPEVQVKYRGKTGDAVVFSNVLPDGSPDFNTVHAGLPPTSGRKWILSQWMRTKPFRYRPADLV